MTRDLSALMAVRMSRFCRLGLPLKALFWSTIFSSSSISSWGRSAVMNAFTVTDTCSGFLLSGSAVDTTWSMSCRRNWFSGVSTFSHSSGSMRSTTYLDEREARRKHVVLAIPGNLGCFSSSAIGKCPK